MKTFGILVRHSPCDVRLFGRVIRKQSGDVVVAWSVHQPPKPSRVPAWNPHATYHQSGRLHSKSYDRPAITKQLQPPNSTFKGTQPIEVTNADRMLSSDLPSCAPSEFDDVLEIPLEMVTGEPKQFVSVDVVEPGADPIRQTGKDKVLVEAVFKDDIPWIVVTFGESPDF